MDHYWPVLLSCALFQGISQQELEQLFACLGPSLRSWEKGEYLLRSGDAVTQIGILLAGKAHIIKEDYWGHRFLMAGLSPGDLFGEAFACVHTLPAPVGVVAQEPSQALYLPVDRLLRPCESACGFHNRLVGNLLEVVAYKNLQLTQKLEHLSRRTIREKLLSYLSAQAQEKGESSFQIPFNRQQLADYLSVDRCALSNELSKMRQEGILDFHRSQFVLHTSQRQHPF